MPDVEFEITEFLGIIKEKKGGWNKELNLVSWSGSSPKYDIRDWSSDHEKMSKGITLTEEELINLYRLIGKALNSNNNSNAINESGIADVTDGYSDAFLEELSELEQELEGEYNG